MLGEISRRSSRDVGSRLTPFSFIELCGYGLRAESPRSQVGLCAARSYSQVVCRKKGAGFSRPSAPVFHKLSNLTCQIENFGQLEVVGCRHLNELRRRRWPIPAQAFERSENPVAT